MTSDLDSPVVDDNKLTAVDKKPINDNDIPIAEPVTESTVSDEYRLTNGLRVTRTVEYWLLNHPIKGNRTFMGEVLIDASECGTPISYKLRCQCSSKMRRFIRCRHTVGQAVPGKKTYIQIRFPEGAMESLRFIMVIENISEEKTVDGHWELELRLTQLPGDERVLWESTIPLREYEKQRLAEETAVLPAIPRPPLAVPAGNIASDVDTNVLFTLPMESTLATEMSKINNRTLHSDRSLRVHPAPSPMPSIHMDNTVYTRTEETSHAEQGDSNETLIADDEVDVKSEKKMQPLRDCVLAHIEPIVHDVLREQYTIEQMEMILKTLQGEPENDEHKAKRRQWRQMTPQFISTVTRRLRKVLGEEEARRQKTSSSKPSSRILSRCQRSPSCQDSCTHGAPSKGIANGAPVKANSTKRDTLKSSRGRPVGSDSSRPSEKGLLAGSSSHSRRSCTACPITFGRASSGIHSRSALGITHEEENIAK